MIEELEVLCLCLVVGLAAACADYAHAVYAARRDAAEAHPAARWSVLQWASMTVGFVAAVKVSMATLPFEAAGLYVGTWLAVRRRLLPPTPREHSQR